MCKVIKDILDPLNIFGKRKKHVSAVVSAHTGYPVTEVTHTIVWSGEQLEASYILNDSVPQLHRDKYTTYKIGFSNGNNTTETIGIETGKHRPVPQTGVLLLLDNTIYFNCTNVTYLECDGQVLIS